MRAGSAAGSPEASWNSAVERAWPGDGREAAFPQQGIRFSRPRRGNRKVVPVTAAHDYDDLHHLVDRLSPRQAERLRVMVAADPEFASAAQPEVPEEGEQEEKRRLSVVGIWESGHGDLAERHDEIIRGRLKRPA